MAGYQPAGSALRTRLTIRSGSHPRGPAFGKAVYYQRWLLSPSMTN